MKRSQCLSNLDNVLARLARKLPAPSGELAVMSRQLGGDGGGGGGAVPAAEDGEEDLT